MRLNPKEISAIKNAFKNNLTIPFSLYLFGSRADDIKKGGDIDLLIVVEKNQKQTVVALKTKIRLQIFEHIPEQRIDITVASQDELKLDPFLINIMPNSIKLL